ncbi:MAG: hypothetical protein OZSIB_1719 [Candidatus Ozemobacter sibiricus]|uniref:Uncharacterized protein n=1 Tax=Candidatus Ozemobacter sibiricus TaxID=2268124 RepID=A0A367ZJ95_9BACT|nr:MAG: hypothetical protein OZSIB_1719 [Candidatus Ozemobacter sibiricus]
MVHGPLPPGFDAVAFDPVLASIMPTSPIDGGTRCDRSREACCRLAAPRLTEQRCARLRTVPSPPNPGNAPW